MISFELPRWYDLHTHLRQDGLLEPVIKAHLDMGCVGILAMPNTKPPMAKVLESDPLPYWSLENYQSMIRDNGGDVFDDIITPLYITKDTSVAMIEEGAKSGLLKAAKYYPPHGTTGADFGMPMNDLLKSDIFKAMSDNNVTLCIHGEEHHLSACDYFDRDSNAEELFYKETMPRVLDENPQLRIVGEHLTTKIAVDFITEAPDHVGGTITPQHLLYTIGDLIQGLKYHLFCLPVVKFDADRRALCDAVTNPKNTKFFAGTDSAPHTIKATACGCAAGCFTAGIAPQLYVDAFEQAGLDMNDKVNQTIFEQFLCRNGAHFYGLDVPKSRMRLTKTPQKIEEIQSSEGDITPLPLGLGQSEINWSLELI